MATFNRVPRDELERMARQAYAREFPADAAPSVAPKNVRVTRLLLGDTLKVEYRGVTYELGHVSVLDGLVLQEARIAIERADRAQTDLDRLTPDVMRDYYAALRRVTELAPRYLIPTGRVRRMVWRLGLVPNPFRRATESEVGQLLGFFLACPTRSRVRYLAT